MNSFTELTHDLSCFAVQFSSYILITPLHTIYNQKNYKEIQQCAKEINTRIHYKNNKGIKNEKVGKNCMQGITSQKQIVQSVARKIWNSVEGQPNK